MKSTLFKKKDIMDNEEFVKDIKKFLDLDPTVFKKLSAFTSRTIYSRNKNERYKIYDEASNVLGISRAKLIGPFSVSRFFLIELTSMGVASTDAPADIVDDLKEIFKFPEEKKQPLIDFFVDLKEFVKKEAEQVLKRSAHATSSLPNISSIDTMLDYRIVFDKEYHIDEDIGKFMPQCLGTIPLGIINIELSKDQSEGQSKNIFFQADKRTIRFLIDHLKSLENRIEIAQKYFNFTETTNYE